MPEPTLSEQILLDVKDDPTIIGDAIGEVENADVTETPPKGETRPEIPLDETPTEIIETAPETPAEKPAAEVKPTVEDQLKALADTVKDLSSKFTALQTPPQQQVTPTIDPASGDLLAGVFDETSLQKAEKDCEALVEFAETHRDGAYEYEVRDDKGNVTKKDFTPEQVTNIKLRAEAALRAIPKRRDYIAARVQCDAKAVEIYPDLGKQDSAWRKDAAEMLALVPQLANVPNFFIWIGHALRGRDEFLKAQAGKKNGNANVAKIQAAPKEVAPAVVNTRGTIAPTAARKLAAASSRLQKERSTEAAEELLEAMGI